MNIPDNIEELRQLLLSVLEENAVLKQKNSLLEERIKELEFQLKSNSHNSNKPPSTDGYKKKPALPKIKHGKKGGQKGHNGDTLKQISNPDTTIIQQLNNCSCCGGDLTKILKTVSEARQVFDLPQPHLLVTEYQNQKCTCPHCGTLQYSSFPDGVNAPVQYGNGVKALTVLLNVVYNVPFKKVGLLFKDLFGHPINESTISSSNEICYQNLAATEINIRSQIEKSSTAHFDETGIRSVGKLIWLHTAATAVFTYLWVHLKRGKEAFESSKSILPKFSGWAMHDCWMSYFNFSNMKHCICGAHLLRELEALIENKSSWANEFKTFLLELYYFRKKNPTNALPEWKTKYDEICEKAELEEPPPIITGKRGKYKRTKGRNLLKRLKEHKDAVLAFAYNSNVPFTNNQAERDIRPVKIKQKVSGCFRTFHGVEIYARIAGYASTLRKNQFNIFKELCNTFTLSNINFSLNT